MRQHQAAKIEPRRLIAPTAAFGIRRNPVLRLMRRLPFVVDFFIGRELRIWSSFPTMGFDDLAMKSPPMHPKKVFSSTATFDKTLSQDLQPQFSGAASPKNSKAEPRNDAGMTAPGAQ
jgi:hypothetical protein